MAEDQSFQRAAVSLARAACVRNSSYCSKASSCARWRAWSPSSVWTWCSKKGSGSKGILARKTRAGAGWHLT